MISRLLLAVALLCAVSYGQVSVSPLLQPHQEFTDASGAPCAGCVLFSYTAGTTTPAPTYTDASGSVPNTNPIVLSVQGGANIWVNTAVAYKFVLKNTTGTTIWTVDNIRGGISSNPGGSQGITQAPGTDFGINTSGGGKFNYNGSEVLNVATGVQKNPPGSQTVTQLPSTSFYVNSSNGVANAMAFPGGDICQKIAAAIAFLPATGGTVDLNGLSSISPAACSSNPFAANNAAPGSPKPIILKLGPGTINTTVPWLNTRDNVSIEGAGNKLTTLHYTGTTDILNPDGGPGGILEEYVTPGGGPITIQGVSLSKIRVAAGAGSGSHVPYAVLISQAVHSNFNDISAWGATRAGIMVVGDAVANQYIRPIVSFQFSTVGDDTTVPLDGVFFMGTNDANQVTQSVVMNPLIEGVGVAQTGYTPSGAVPTTTTGSGTGATITILSVRAGQIIGYNFTGGSGYKRGDIVTPTQEGSTGARFIVGDVSGGAITNLQETGCGMSFLFAHGIVIKGGLIEQNLAFDACIDNYPDSALATPHSQMIEFDDMDWEASQSGVVDYGQGTILKNNTIANFSPPIFGGQNTLFLGGQALAIYTTITAQNVMFDSVMLPFTAANITDFGTNTRFIHPWSGSAIGNVPGNPFPWSYKEKTFTGYNAAFGLQRNPKTDLKGIWFWNTSAVVTIFDDAVTVNTPWHMIMKGEWQDNNNFGAAMNAGIIELSQTNNVYTTTDGVQISFSTSTGKLVATNLSSSHTAQFVGTIEFIPSNASSASSAAIQTGDSISAGALLVGGVSVTTAGSPIVNQAACIKAAGPPVVIGYCSTVVGAGGACTCN